MRMTLALSAAIAAAAVGGAFALVSVFWGLGGTALLDTVGGSLEAQGRAGSAGIVVLLWVSVLLKLIAAVLPLAVLQRWGPPGGRRWVRVLAWLAAVILTGYGLLLTSVGLLVQAGVIATDASADHRALAWHAYLWDPWFLVWGLLSLAALLAGRSVRDRRIPVRHGTAASAAGPLAHPTRTSCGRPRTAEPLGP
jgi:hypothetical protein